MDNKQLYGFNQIVGLYYQDIRCIKGRLGEFKSKTYLLNDYDFNVLSETWIDSDISNNELANINSSWSDLFNPNYNVINRLSKGLPEFN